MGGQKAERRLELRRTSTVDILRPGGLADTTLVVAAGARDSWTADQGVRTLAELQFQGLIAVEGGTVLRLTSDPSVSFDAILGSSLYAGFRAAVARALPGEVAERSVLFRVLDDLPGALIVSGYAYAIAGQEAQGRRREAHELANLCAGWVSGGTMQRNHAAGHLNLRAGPLAPDLVGENEHWWHSLTPLAPHAIRRARTLTVRVSGDGPVVADAAFRDTHVNTLGVEHIIHEYGIEAGIDIDTGVVTHIRARPGALPWDECPAAASSALGLVGRSIDEHDRLIRQEFTGVTSCTHLNDALRALGDVQALLPARS